MDTPESLIAAPLAISIFFGAQAFLRGRNPGEEVAVTIPDITATVPVEPLFLLGALAALLLTGGILVAMEMRAEARDAQDGA